MTDEPRWVRRANVRRVRRPSVSGSFELAYVRTGGADGVPVVLLPGGPGLASVLPYWGLRSKASARGLDVIMMEHRGVGLSRQDTDGRDLPREAVTVADAADDLAAVLDDCGVSRAVIYGTSYGSYLAQAFGVRHPDRVAGMVLDSTVLEADKNETSKANLRRLFWDGTNPETESVTAQLRYLVESDSVPVRQTGPVVRTTYEFGGLGVLERMVDNVGSGRLATWNWVAGLGERELTSVTRHVMEGDLVAGIAFGELGFGLGSDGLPLDPNVRFGELAADEPPFTGEAFDLPASLPDFDWPTAVVSGERDMRSPRLNAERAAALIPGAMLVPFDGLGHSVLDSHPLAALHVAHAVAVGAQPRLPELVQRIAALPRHGSMAWLGRLIDTRLRAERLLSR